MKPCIKCGTVLPLTEYYRHDKMADGHINKCKTCTKSDVKVNREARSEYYLAYDRARGSQPDRKQAAVEYGKEYRQRPVRAESLAKYKASNALKVKAHNAVSNALRDGKLVKLPCFICGDLKVEGHHPDYSAPLIVVWLCTKHHAETHREYDSQEDLTILETTVKGSRWD